MGADSKNHAFPAADLEPGDYSPRTEAYAVQRAGVDQEAGVARAAAGRMAGRTARNFSLSSRAPLEGMKMFVSNSRIDQDCQLP